MALACKSKECEPALSLSGQLQAALLEDKLTEAKALAEDVAKQFGSSDTPEIKWLGGQAGALPDAIDGMQREGVKAEERQTIRDTFESAKKGLLGARTDLQRVCG